jgi:tetratricopeptide (TPR) repeat protein
VSTCLDPETLAAFAEGFLSRDEAKAVLAHLEECDDCMTTVEALNETIATRPREVRTSRPYFWWLAAAAAVVIAFIGVRYQRSPMSRLIALVPQSGRPVEPRLSADFPWAAYHGPLRAEEADTDPQKMRLIGTAGDIVANADRDRSATAQENAGIALLLIDKPQAAIDRLQAATKSSPNDVGAWSDLAAAQYSAAMRLSRPSLLPEALVSADRALRLDPHHAPSLFNRALILEHLGLTNEARQAWQRYLETDASSPWAVEARARLAKLDVKPAASNAQKARTFAEAETLARWAEAFQRGDEASAQRELKTARETGDMLVKSSGESLLHDAVRAIDEGSNRVTLADAHLAYRRGRIAYARQQLDAALPDLDRAARLFAQAHSPMSLVARYYAASVRFDHHDVAAARDELQTLLGETAAHPQFIALGAEVRWELALSFMIDNDWSGALPLLEQSRDAFARLDERNHLGFVESLLADTLFSLGRMDESWAARSRAFALLSSDGSGDRLPVGITTAARLEVRNGNLAAARSLLDAEHTAAIQSDAIAADALVHSALVNAALGDAAEAQRSLREASATVDRIADAAARQLARTHLDLAGASVVVKSDPARARELLTRAIDAYRASGRTVYLPECFLLRARAGDGNAAAADLESGIEMLERSRIRTGAVVGTGVLNAGVALFQDAIRLCAARGDVAGAFAYAERSRAQLEGAPPVGLRELQQRLANSDTAVLEIAQLPETLIEICVTADRAELAREQAPSIAPFASLLASAKQLIVVADRSLQATPFAALDDGGHFLVERMAVSLAMSASALTPMPRNANGALLAVALPTGGATAGLPESTREIADVTPLYRNAVTIAPERATFAAFADAAPAADVIHIAGHTAQPSNDAGTALVFAGDRVTWSAIAAKHLPRSPVVILAACETLRPHATLTLGDGFLAAGASDVIGTLTPIADADAHELFQSIHRRLAAGSPPAEVVRDAQLEAIARHSTAWRAVTSLTRCIHTNVRRS